LRDSFTQEVQRKPKMPQLTVEVPHALGKEEAMRRIQMHSDFARGMYGSQVSDLQEQWNENVLTFGFRAMGMKVAGTLTVEEALVRLLTELPWAAMMFKGMIDQRVRQDLGRILGAGEQSP
jgi:hypothetical protein